MKLAPRSLYGRLALILFGGLLLAQLLSAGINLAERDQLLVRTTGMQSAQRIADIVKLLDSVGGVERQRIAGIFNASPLTVALDRKPPSGAGLPADSPRERMFTGVLRSALGDDRPLVVRAEESADAPGPGFGPGHHAGMMGGTGPFAGPRQAPVSGPRFLVQIRLKDDSWVTFDTRMPHDVMQLPWRLAVTLAILLATVLLLSLFAVRWVTRPLNALASAAEALGRDIHRPPLPEQGPTEVKRAAQAFNSMQTRLVRFIDDRTRILTAMSHDLKTPITRMRLRAELLDDDQQRLKFENDLKEMEAMVAQTLDFMRGLGHETRQRVDIMALIESLKADNAELGRVVTIEGRAAAPIDGMPLMLKRCIGNLLDNAVLHGRVAHVSIADGTDSLIIRVRDEGPGIPEDELERVFEPFYRLEASRNRETGGTGLGLGIAREIARAHGGDVTLRNSSRGGLEAVATLSRKHPA